MHGYHNVMWIDKDLTIAELATLVASFSNNNNKIEILTPKSGKPAARYAPDIERAKKELNLSVSIDLKEAIRKTISFYS